jgi:manganese transport protein
MRVVGRFERSDVAQRKFWRQVFVVVLATTPAVFYWLFASPVKMVVAGGLAQTLMLPIIGLATLHLRHRRLPAALRPSAPTTAALWISTTVMLAVALYYGWTTIGAPRLG